MIPRSQKPQKHTIPPLQKCADHITIPFLWRTKPHFHAGRNNTKHTILSLWGPHKAHNSVLVDHITVLCSWRQYKAAISWLWRQYKAHNSTLVETIQSKQFRACGSHYNSMLVYKTQFHADGDNTRHTIPCLQKPHEAHNSALVESIQSIQFCTCKKLATISYI